MDNSSGTNTCSCDNKKGRLPSCAPLSAGYVPFQKNNPSKYDSEDALTRGTLFPGLDLPFMNVVNEDNPYAGTPLGELMALEFAVKELNLYLDTHKDDKEAFNMLKKLIDLSREGKERYAEQYGALTVADMELMDGYTWLNDPWPWDYSEGMDD